MPFLICVSAVLTLKYSSAPYLSVLQIPAFLEGTYTAFLPFVIFLHVNMFESELKNSMTPNLCLKLCFGC